MNANKLADKLDDMEPYFLDDLPILEAAANMLMKQQAEIEALKTENKFFKDLMGDVEILRKAQEK